MYPSVKFQRAASNLETFKEVKKSDISHCSKKSTLSGAEAKEFYESLLGKSDKTRRKCMLKMSKSTRRKRKFKRDCSFDANKVNMNESVIGKDNKLTSDIRQENLFLKMAQDGDVEGLCQILKDKTVDINTTDRFGWTALMCASKSRHRPCVEFLLKEGADVNVCNNIGETTMDIAKQSGISDVFHASRKSKYLQKFDDSEIPASMMEKTCDVCNAKFYGSKQKHDTSTAHLFNCQYKSERTVYHISENNIGFKLMKQKGWDQEKGLGPEGTGRKFPVKTILKQDRLGLGSKHKDKAKITHFSARDSSAVDSTKGKTTSDRSRFPRKSWKKECQRKQDQERKWEHNLRVYMNTE